MLDSFLKKITLGEYPEYTNALNAIEAARASNSSIQSSYALAYGQNFNKFTDKQPNTIATVLGTINPIGLDLLNTHFESVSQLQQYAASFVQLKQLLEQHTSKIAEKHSTMKEEQKARDKLNQNENRLNQLRRSGRNDAADKMQATVDQDQQALQVAISNRERKDREYQSFSDEMMVKFPSTLTDITIPVIRHMKSMAEKRAELGAKIFESANQITKYDDFLLANLQNRLNAWNQTTV